MSFDKISYWKKRSVEKLRDAFTRIDAIIRELEGMANHVNLEKKRIDKAVANLLKSFSELENAFTEAKVKKGGVNGKSK